jgi:hypothetical protein
VVGAGLPDDDGRLEQDLPRWRGAVRDPVQEQFGGGSAEPARRLDGDRQRRLNDRHPIDLVEPDQGDVVGDAQAPLPDRPEGTD